MLVVVVDTATPAVTAALAELRRDGVEILARRVTVDARAHGELLAPGCTRCSATPTSSPATCGRRRRHRPRPVHRPAGRPGHRRRAWARRWASRRTASARSTPSAGVGRAPCWSPPTPGAARCTGRSTADGERISGPAVDKPADGRPSDAGPGGRRRRPACTPSGSAPVPTSRAIPAPRRWPPWPPTRIRARAPGEPLTPLYLRRPDARQPAAAQDRSCRERSDRLRWWHIDELLPIEDDLFGAEQLDSRRCSGTSWPAALLPWSALDGDQVLGYAGLAVTAPDEAWVQNIAVRRDAQRRGIGRHPAGDAARRGRPARDPQDPARGGRRQRPAQKLYAAYGFEPVGVRRGYYQPSNTDALVMMREVA